MVDKLVAAYHTDRVRDFILSASRSRRSRFLTGDRVDGYILALVSDPTSSPRPYSCRGDTSAPALGAFLTYFLHG